MIDINLNGAYLAVFAVKDEMIRRSFGRIVMISSIAALLPASCRSITPAPRPASWP